MLYTESRQNACEHVSALKLSHDLPFRDKATLQRFGVDWSQNNKVFGVDYGRTGRGIAS